MLKTEVLLTTIIGSSINFKLNTVFPSEGVGYCRVNTSCILKKDSGFGGLKNSLMIKGSLLINAKLLYRYMSTSVLPTKGK